MKTISAGKPAGPKERTGRPYIYEVDLLRAMTAFTVVAIHALSYTGFLITTRDAGLLGALVGHAMHYNRELFMFVSGLVLTYVYADNPRFHARRFWLGRFWAVFVPYALWSVVYVLYNDPAHDLYAYLKLSAVSILKGNASFQLYYILLALQFYALFPAFLPAIRKAAKRPWTVLGASLLAQLALAYVSYVYLQSGALSHMQFAKLFVSLQDRLIFMYGFFFILGGIAALHIERVREFLRTHGRAISVTAMAALGLYSIYFYMEIFLFGEPPALAASVIQPSVVLYSIVMIVLLGWASLAWARRRPAYRLVKAVSEVSFGIYFVQAFALDFVMARIYPLLPKRLPMPAVTLSVLIAAFTLSAAFCYALYKVPLLSWTIGRARKVKVLAMRRTKRAAEYGNQT